MRKQQNLTATLPQNLLVRKRQNTPTRAGRVKLLAIQTLWYKVLLNSFRYTLKNQFNVQQIR